ncbi:hypothetical protein [Roseateles chitinivorans]|uniref:hypothetical protein n=1 Tax=Roseateles chitinivorans TaxID=2917965 RepID=UPI003D667BF9
MQTVDKYDDRALVLSYAAFTEEALGELLKCFLKRGDSADRLLDSSSSPLGSFGNRIKACHALGLISNIQKTDFEILQRIRNAFAHAWDGISLDRADIADRLKALSGDNFGTSKMTEGGRSALIGSISVRCLELQLRIQRFRNGHEPRIEDNWYHLGGAFPKGTGSTEEGENE